MSEPIGLTGEVKVTASARKVSLELLELLGPDTPVPVFTTLNGWIRLDWSAKRDFVTIDIDPLGGIESGGKFAYGCVMQGRGRAFADVLIEFLNLGYK